jgi:hypothetical protein
MTTGGGRATRSLGGVESPGDWQCEMCTFFNGAGMTKCEMCSTPRDCGGADKDSAGKGGTVRTGGGGSSSVSGVKHGARGGPLETHLGAGDKGKGMLIGGGGGKGSLTGQSAGAKAEAPAPAGASMGPALSGKGRDTSGGGSKAAVKGPPTSMESGAVTRVKRTRTDTPTMDWPCSMCTLLNPAHHDQVGRASSSEGSLDQTSNPFDASIQFVTGGLADSHLLPPPPIEDLYVCAASYGSAHCARRHESFLAPLLTRIRCCQFKPNRIKSQQDVAQQT